MPHACHTGQAYDQGRCKHHDGDTQNQRSAGKPDDAESWNVPKIANFVSSGTNEVNASALEKADKTEAAVLWEETVFVVQLNVMIAGKVRSGF